MHMFEKRGLHPVILDPDLPWDRVVLTVVIPCYNEVSTVENLLRKVREVPLKMEVIVVDDGSSDGTRDLLPELAAKGLIDDLVFHERNAGKGAALRDQAICLLEGPNVDRLTEATKKLLVEANKLGDKGAAELLALTGERFCRHCSNAMPLEVRFCPKCGGDQVPRAKVEVKPPPQQPPPG